MPTKAQKNGDACIDCGKPLDDNATPLQEKSPNKVANVKPTKDDDTKKKGTKRSKPDDSKDDKPAAKKQKPSASAKEDSNDDGAWLSTVKLPGEDSTSVPIFDTCDDVRKKINDHLKKEASATSAGFARDLSKILHVDGRQMGAFLRKKGPREGAQSPAFYAGYVYFEKLRVRDGKGKSKKREEMEKAWKGQGGFPREGSHNMYVTLMGGESASLDRLGVLQIKKGNSTGGGFRRKRVK